MIDENRKKHIFGVAEFLKEFAIESNLSEEDCKDLYTLGLLHDIGYAFTNKENQKDHNKIGGEILKKQGYKYWKEVYYHGIPNSPYQSRFLDLLNWADMHIDGYGNYATAQERLEDVSRRYNTKIEDLECAKIVEELKQKGLN